MSRPTFTLFDFVNEIPELCDASWLLLYRSIDVLMKQTSREMKYSLNKENEPVSMPAVIPRSLQFK